MAATTLSAQPILAQCLTSDGAERGFRITFANGDVTSIRALGADVFEVIESFDGGQEHWRYDAMHSTYNFTEVPMRAGVALPENRVRTDWGQPIEDLPVPSLGLPEVSYQITTIAGDGAIEDQGSRVVRVAEAPPISLGQCDYQVISVGMLTLWEQAEDPKIQVWSYLPELGIGFITGWDWDGEYQETTATAIEPM